MSRPIVFFGNERLATGLTTTAPVLRALIDGGYDIKAIVVAQQTGGKSRRERPLEVAEVAAALKIPLMAPDDLAVAGPELAALGAPLAVLVAYGKIIPQSLLDLFPLGIVNIHPSLLPLHRGSTPLESVILEGATSTGVSLMRLSAKMDAGPVYAQQTVPLNGNESKQILADDLATIGAELLTRHLPEILNGTLASSEQDEAAATYDQPLSKAHAQLDWGKPAMQLEREIRAYAGWPRSSGDIGYTKVIITEAHVVEGAGEPGSMWLQDKQLGICTADGVLVIDKLIPAGKPEMTAQAFLAGYKP